MHIYISYLYQLNEGFHSCLFVLYIGWVFVFRFQLRALCFGFTLKTMTCLCLFVGPLARLISPWRLCFCQYRWRTFDSRCLAIFQCSLGLCLFLRDLLLRLACWYVWRFVLRRRFWSNNHQSWVYWRISSRSLIILIYFWNQSVVEDVLFYK